MEITELFAIPLRVDKYIVYAPLQRSAFIGNTAMVDYLARSREGMELGDCNIDDAALGFLKRIEVLAADEDVLPIATSDGVPCPIDATLLLTTACNLRCLYCYASSGDRPLEFMSLSTAKHAIDFIISNAVQNGSEQIQVNYHGGGEPTVHWTVLTKSLEYAKDRAAKHDISVMSSLSTNGILSSDQVGWMIDNLDSCSVSYDGHPEVQDLFRVRVSGKGSSDAVIATMKRLDESDFQYGIRMTVAADAISRIAESVEFICTNLQPATIQIEPAYALGRWKNQPSSETEAFVLNYLEAQEVAERHGRHVSFSGARLGVLTNHFCGVSRDSFAVSSDGNVTACLEAYSENVLHASTFFYGTSDPIGCGYTFNMERLDYLRQQTVENREYCKDCFAKWTCAGDCYYKFISQNGDVEFCGSDRCYIIQELTKHQILKRILDAGGLFWHEMPPGQKDMIPRDKTILRNHDPVNLPGNSGGSIP